MREKLQRLKASYNQLETEAKKSEIKYKKAKPRLEYLENLIRTLEQQTSAKIRKYEGVKNSLDELEKALKGIREEIIEPNLEAKIKYEKAKTEDDK